ncbi:MAG: MAPEG family protein [Devosia sp.]
MQGFSLWLIGALLAQGAIALVLLLVLGAIRVPMVVSGRIPMRDIALSRDPWPDHEKRVSNAFDNQFQLPVLFYLGGAISLYLGTIWIEVVVAWLFVISRVAHAAVFAITNTVPQRFLAYSLGYGVLAFFWLELILRVLFIAIWNRV